MHDFIRFSTEILQNRMQKMRQENGARGQIKLAHREIAKYNARGLSNLATHLNFQDPINAPV
jgi:hypothetical protein